jgi:hypothetical protein
MSYFVVEYDRTSSQFTVTGWRDDYASALADLEARERDGRTSVEVVLLMGESLESLKTTHSRYFVSARELLASLGGNLLATAH